MTGAVTAATVPLRFQIGARTLLVVRRRLRRVGFGLEQVLEGTAPVLPSLASDEAGWLVTSVPERQAVAPAGYVTLIRQRYDRHHLDLAAGEAAWLAGLSASARNGIKRKRRKLAEANGGALDIRRYRDGAGIATFHPLARGVSTRTYQERLLGGGLPDDPASLIARAGRDEVRAWLLFLNGAPVAYLACIADGDVLRYDYVGHDPVWNALSPGAVLQVEALANLFADRFRYFDFTEGEGQHKRQFASGSRACVDLLILRPTAANQVLAAALGGWDRAVAAAKASALLSRLAAKVRR